MTRTALWILILVAIAFGGCYQDIFEAAEDVESVQWNPTLALPITNGSYNIIDILDELATEQLQYEVAEDGLVTLVFRKDSVVSRTAEELVQIDDEVYNTSIPLGTELSTELPVTGSITKSVTHYLDVNTPDGDSLYTAVLKGGLLDISITSDFPADGEITLTFFAVNIQGEVLETTFSWTDDGSGTQQFLRSVDLAGAVLDLTEGGTTANQLGFTVDLALQYNGSPVGAASSIALRLESKSLEFQQATGNFKSRPLSSKNGAFDFTFNDLVKGGLYYFDRPSVTLNFYNSFGVGVEATLESLTAHSMLRGDLALTGPVVGNPVALDYPDINNIGSFAQSRVVAYRGNSNIDQILAWQPDAISYTYNAAIAGGAPDEVHFVLDSSRLRGDVVFALPLEGRFRDLTLVEQYDFDGSLFEDAQDALFRLATDNGLPMHANLQVYFLAAGGAFIDSLIYDDRNLVLPGMIDDDGVVVQSTSANVDVAVGADRLAALAQAERLVLRATLNTPLSDTRSVKILEGNEIEISLLVQTEFEISF
jgi:hypothetical protein